MRTILLTGATGFLGSHLLKAFLESNYNVVILKRRSSSLERIQKFIGNLRCHDIDREDLNTVFTSNAIDAIVHTATEYGRGTPLSAVVTTNLLFPAQLLEYAIKHQVHSFINTDTFYTRFYDQYALSKKQFVDWLKFKQNDIRVANLCLEHMYGPSDNRNKFLPQVIQKLLRNETIDLTPGQQRRDLVYVEDVASAFLLAVQESLTKQGPMLDFGLGSGASISIAEVVNLLKDLTAGKSQLNFGAFPYRSEEIMESHADISGLRLLGWNPAVPLAEGLKRTIEYERSMLCHAQNS